MERRLAAILAADVVGFSSHVGRNEEAAIRALKAHLAIMEPMITIHAGRIFKSTGDGFLAEFPSVVDAVSCADAMQKKISERNANEDASSRLVFRMGIHTGDVVIDDEDILGDGVNIAARLEAIASPGGVAVSARVYDDVVNKLELAFENLGQYELKNITQPIQVYALGEKAADQELAHVALPDKPSIAVLPFTNTSAQADEDYFADGVTEDMISALTHVPWIFVIARNSTFSYKGLKVDARRISRELGVRYILEGSVRRSSNRLRVSGQLIDAETGGHIWAERYDGVIEDVFDLQDQISEAVATAIAPEIRTAEIQRGLRKPISNLDAYDLYLRGQNALHLGRLDEAHDWLGKSILAAPGFAKAMALKAWLGTAGHLYGRQSTIELRDTCLELAYGAIEVEPADPEVLAFAGYTIGFYEGNPRRGLGFIDQVTARCPSFAWAWASSSMLSSFCGDSDRAIEHGHIALRLSPRDPLAFRVYLALALAHAVKGDHQAVLESAERGLALNPRAMNIQRCKIIALTELGRTDEAAKALAQFMEILPEFSTKEYLTNVKDNVGVAETVWSRTITSMAKAGFPE